MLSTTQDPNTSNLAVSIRVSYRLPAYGRLCLELVHSADSLLINMYLFYSNYRVNQSDTLSQNVAFFAYKYCKYAHFLTL